MQCLRVAKFIRIVESEAAQGLVVIMGQTGSANCNERYGWPEMADETFRTAVLAQLDKRKSVRDYRFSMPDSYDDWTFYAYPLER